MEDIILITGYIAGALTTVSFLPQVIRSWRLRETRDISLLMLILFGIGICLWTVYGLWVDSPPIIAANAVTMVLVAFLLGLKAKYH
jgi:MtN3 and saliva related transmembrane protein